MKQPQPLTMPPQVFAQAVNLARAPNTDRHGWRRAIERITTWWNNAADFPFQSAYGLSLYVRFGEEWLSGNPEECWVDAATWAQGNSPCAQAALLGGDLIVVLHQEAVDIDPFSFESKAVDASRGISGGMLEGTTGNDTVDDLSFEVLSIFPDRFPEAWLGILDSAAQDTSAYGVTL